jgi:hypothetical protein
VPLSSSSANTSSQCQLGQLDPVRHDLQEVRQPGVIALQGGGKLGQQHPALALKLTQARADPADPLFR